MIAKFISWLIELFRKKPEKQVILEEKIEELKEEIKEIDEESNNSVDIVDHFNK